MKEEGVHAENVRTHFVANSQVVWEMEMMRSLSGAEHFDYLGFSYATILDDTYATLFPAKAGGMVFDSTLVADRASFTVGFDQQVALATEIKKMITSGMGSDYPFVSTSKLITLPGCLDVTPGKAVEDIGLSSEILTQFLVGSLYKAPTERNERLGATGKAKRGDQKDIDVLLVLAGLVTSVDKIAPTDAAQPGSRKSGNEGGAPKIDPSGEIVKCNSFPKNTDIANVIACIKEKGMPEFFG
ncbi:Uncharacterised protein [Actinomyces bovis]|uniref:Uncharacterized protein n=1 Tax=Actinomyces bovis TaxID=1658 RepID=A0ABY1VNQ3_9ACTO|nr:hypothetical protein [Actinomyces bovis]SPT53680.1 Uncharacterised protein [Actinomyces bovis]VEG55790.1 Uncharacterised protein [Actinomyces israelii]